MSAFFRKFSLVTEARYFRKMRYDFYERNVNAMLDYLSVRHRAMSHVSRHPFVLINLPKLMSNVITMEKTDMNPFVAK
jgi:hypothetical protein